jgi:two-component system, response regulator RegA
MTDERLLVIDDDQAFRSRLCRAMTRHGFEVAECGDAREAGKLAQEFNPTHALIDLRMPHHDGLEVLGRLMILRPRLRAVILTGYGHIAAAMEAVRLGASDFLIKPCDAEPIARALKGKVAFAVKGSADAATLERLEWEHIHRVLADQQKNITHAARVLGIDRRSLQRKLAKRPPPLL